MASIAASRVAGRRAEGRMTAKRLSTRRQLEVLRAYIGAGSIAAAAYELGISETTARQHLSGLYRRIGCLNAAQAAYWHGTGGLAQSRSESDSPCQSYGARYHGCDRETTPLVGPYKAAE
jgi:DNA-binding NarL/FixJ family response regulator